MCIRAFSSRILGFISSPTRFSARYSSGCASDGHETIHMAFLYIFWYG